jgi:hypothetical protein
MPETATKFALAREVLTSAVKKIEVDPIEFRAYLFNALLIAGTLGIIVTSLSMATIAFELARMRQSQEMAFQNVERKAFERVDAALWKVDTFLTLADKTNQNLAHGLMEVRVQVKQSQDATDKTAKQLTNATAAVVRETTKQTTEVVKAITEQAANPPVVELKQAAPVVKFDGPVPVRITPPSTVVTPPAAKPSEEEPDEPKRKRWYRKLWPFL